MINDTISSAFHYTVQLALWCTFRTEREFPRPEALFCANSKKVNCRAESPQCPNIVLDLRLPNELIKFEPSKKDANANCGGRECM